MSGDAGARARARARRVRVAPSPAPVEQERVGLSFFDTPWVVLPPIQRVFLYEMSAAAAADGGGGDGFAAAVERLKGSLAATLALTCPWQGWSTWRRRRTSWWTAPPPTTPTPGWRSSRPRRRTPPPRTWTCSGSPATRRTTSRRSSRSCRSSTPALPAPVLSVQATRLGGAPASRSACPCTTPSPTPRRVAVHGGVVVGRARRLSGDQVARRAALPPGGGHPPSRRRRARAPHAQVGRAQAPGRGKLSSLSHFLVPFISHLKNKILRFHQCLTVNCPKLRRFASLAFFVYFN